MKTKLAFRIITLMLAGLLLATSATADTTWVSAGNVMGAWSAQHSPYMISAGSVVVPVDTSLTIGPGTRIVFTGAFEFAVAGRLYGNGAAGDSIRFTCDTLLTSTSWRGLRFLTAHDSSYLDYAVIEFARAEGSGHQRYGGGVEIDSCDVTLRHCSIRHNRALLEGGGLYIHDYANPLLEECVIEHNRTNTRGGGITCRTRVEPRMVRCRIADNHANSDAGGVYLDYRANPDMLGCVVTGNTSNARGGGMFANARRWIRQTRIRNCLWYDNSGATGGAIVADSSEILIDFSTFALNHSTTGAAIQADGCSLVVTNSILAHHTGGAIQHVLAQLTFGTTCFFNDGPTPVIGALPTGFGTLSQTNLLGDSVDAFLNTFHDPAFLDTSQFDFRLTANSRAVSLGTLPVPPELATDIQGLPRPSPSSAPPDLGALENTMHLPGAFLCGEITGNIPAGNFIVACDLVIPEGASVTIDPGARFLFAGDHALIVNGQLVAAGNSLDSILFSTHFSYSGTWGGIVFESASVGNALHYCVFERTGDNAAVNVSSPVARIQNSSFRNCGGAQGVISAHTDSTVILDCRFTNNSIRGIFAHDNAVIFAADCEFVNTAGGVFTRGASRGYFNNCTAERLTDIAFLNTESAELFLDDCQVRHCRGNSLGLAVHGGSAHVWSCTFAFDTTGTGSVISLIGSDVTFSNCAFDSCGTFTTGGGVIAASGGANVSLESCSFTRNSSNSVGGVAVRVQNASTQVTASACYFAGNFVSGATGTGGIVRAENGRVALSRSIFTSNFAGRGGAVHLQSSASTITNCVFHNNSTTSGALYLAASSPEIAGNVFQTSDGPGTVFAEGCANAQVHHNLWHDNSGGNLMFLDGDPGYAPDFIGVLDSVNLNFDSVDTYGNLFADPRFVNSGMGDFSLLASSPCINAGSLTAPIDPDSTIADIGLIPFTVTLPAPSAFALLTPDNGVTHLETPLEFVWQQSLNPDNSPVPFYLFELARDPQFASVYHRTVVSTTNTIVAPEAGHNYWRVLALSSAGRTRYCDASFEFTRPVGLTPFDLIAPVSGFSQPVNWPIEFSWQESIDPEGDDAVTYRMVVWSLERVAEIDAGEQTQLELALSDYDFESGEDIRWSVFAHSVNPDTSLESLSRFWLFPTDSAESAAGDGVIITDFRFYAAYPNPFNASVHLTFDVPRASAASLRIYDLAGREVAILFDQVAQPGRHDLLWDASRNSTGVYFARFETAAYSATHKLLLVK